MLTPSPLYAQGILVKYSYSTGVADTGKVQVQHRQVKYRYSRGIAEAGKVQV